MVLLKKLSIIQVKITLVQLTAILDSLKNLHEFSFTLPKSDSAFKDNKLIECFNRLTHLEIDISNTSILLSFIIEQCLNLIYLKLFSNNPAITVYNDDLVLNIRNLNKLEGLIISDLPNLIIENKYLLEKIKVFKEFKVNFKKIFPISNADINNSLSDNLEWLTTLNKSIRSFEILFKSNQAQSSNTIIVFEFNIESFINHLQYDLQSLTIQIINNLVPTKIFFVINEIEYFKMFKFIETIDLSQIHIHLNSPNLCKILSEFKCNQILWL